jgi:hypothetical protein
MEGVIKQIVEEVLASPDKYPAEARFLLQLQTWYRQGDSYVDVSRYDVLTGEVKEILLNVKDEGYPHRVISHVCIIPCSLPIIIHQEMYSDFGPRKDVVYIFTAKGWIKVEVSENE